MSSEQAPLDTWQEPAAMPVLRVSELSSIIKDLFLDERLQDILVEGEVTNYKHHTRGHRYFSLSDRDGTEYSVINCVMWHSQASRLSFEPEDGLHVIARGYVDLYAPQGKYQLYINSMRLAGTGEKYLLVERWKKELAAEGCFLEERKRCLPEFPGVIGVVTSGTGAVLQDIKNVIGRRFPVRIILSPTAVQGDSAHIEIARAIRNIDGKVDVIIVARGGGSFEDLFPFNHPDVVRAIAACQTPVVSAVGHEVDTTLADYAADARAPTPSAAAEMVVPDRMVLVAMVREYRRVMENILVSRLARACDELETLRDRLHPKRLGRRVTERRQYVDDLSERLETGIQAKVSGGRLMLDKVRADLDGISPLATLARGYCVCEKEGVVIRSARSVIAGDRLKLRLADGRGSVIVEEVSHDKKI